MPIPQEILIFIFILQTVLKWVNYVYRESQLNEIEKLEDQFQMGSELTRFIELCSKKKVSLDEISLVKALASANRKYHSEFKIYFFIFTQFFLDFFLI